MTAAWFSIEQDDPQAVTLRLLPRPDGLWTFDVLREQPLPEESLDGRVVRVTGKASVAAYARAGAWAAQNGAIRLTVEQPQGSLAFDGRPGNSDLASLEALAEEPSIHVLRFDLPTDPQLPLQALGAAIPDLDGVQHLVITGLAPVALYAGAAFCAARAGASSIAADVVHDGVVIAAHAEPDRIGTFVEVPTESSLSASLRFADGDGFVLGVVGDPNTGKSVLSRSLDEIRRTRGIKGWLFDCDMAAPTAPWYLHLVADHRDEAATALRNPIKMSWTPELEALAASKLQTVRKRGGLVIADLPGGRHTVDPPVRIRESRRPLFASVDAFIVIAAADAVDPGAWPRELRAIDLGDRIVGLLTSRDPHAPAAARVARQDGLWRGEISGLDRHTATSELARKLAPALDALVIKAAEQVVQTA